MNVSLFCIVAIWCEPAWASHQISNDWSKWKLTA